mmetsp:Transcript_14248/g.13814  ORF Transcript_14248/g.13814 Transcript_14248/m.13814 type:complete len:82 (-) Transcript_14248:548-793(-)
MSNKDSSNNYMKLILGNQHREKIKMIYQQTDKIIEETLAHKIYSIFTSEDNQESDIQDATKHYCSQADLHNGMKDSLEEPF